MTLPAYYLDRIDAQDYWQWTGPIDLAGRRKTTLYAVCANGHNRYVVRGDRRVCLDCRREASARHRRAHR